MPDAGEPMEGRPRLLFVDDEAHVLAGLRTSLRGQRRRWEMEFANSGAEALERIEAGEPDVIVCDMQMPRLDGAALLERVRQEAPSTIRIVLSGHADPQLAMRALPVAQQWLSKPCDREVLIASLESAVSSSRLIREATEQIRFAGISTLPSVPAVLLEVRRLVADPNTPIDRLIAAVEQDPAISTKILQVTNSGFFALPCQVTSLAEAIPRLGFEMVQSLTISESVFQAFEADDNGNRQTVAELQRDALCCARLASALCTASGRSGDFAAEAFTAGLLRDVGLLALLGSPQKEALVDHAKLGAGLLAAWGLPMSIVDSAARHHDLTALPGEPSHSGLLIQVATAWLEERAVAQDGEDVSDRNALRQVVDHYPHLATQIELNSCRRKAEVIFNDRLAESRQG